MTSLASSIDYRHEVFIQTMIIDHYRKTELPLPRKSILANTQRSHGDFDNPFEPRTVFPCIMEVLLKLTTIGVVRLTPDGFVPSWAN